MSLLRYIRFYCTILAAGVLLVAATAPDAPQVQQNAAPDAVLPVTPQPMKTIKDNPAYVVIKKTSFTRDSILVGDQVVWSTVFTLPSNKSLVIAPYAEQAGQAKIDVLQEFRLDTLSIKDGIAQLEARLLFTSFDSGYFQLPQPLVVAAGTEGADTIYFDPQSIAVNTIQVDTTAFKPFDIKGQMGYPITFKEVLPWILLVLLVLAAVYVLFRYIRYRKENRDFFGKPVVQDPPHIIALRELDKLRTQKLWQGGREKQYYTGITDTLRAYMEARYHIAAMEKTSSEIMESLAEQQVEAKPYKELNELFKLADLVKFAKYTPIEGENEEAVLVAVRFVNSTFMQEMEQEQKNSTDQKGEEK